MNNITVKYIYSACVLIQTPDVKILCDPWFTEGIYDGAWYLYPRVENPIDLIGNVVYIDISHIHPDHYDPYFLRKYFEKYGMKKLIIANHKFNHLKNKIISDSLNYEIIENNLLIGDTVIRIFPHDTGSFSDIDSAILVSYFDGVRAHKVLNCNDIVFNDDFLLYLKNIVGQIDILLLGYTGAGPYPQCYFDMDDPELVNESINKKKKFINRYMKNISIFNARVNIPFAGKYLLGGNLARLNNYRGIADAVEILQHDKNAIILADAGGYIDSKSFLPSATRCYPYDTKRIDNYIMELSHKKLDYERFIDNNFDKKIPIEYLLKKSFNNAILKSEIDYDYYICIYLIDKYFVMNCNKNKFDFFIADVDNIPQFNRSIYYLDLRYLFGLLTKVFHWNNAEVGSQLKVRRKPNFYDKNIIKFMNFLTV